MDQACFEAWLEGIRSLSGQQRSLTFRQLSLAEAADDGEVLECASLSGAEMAVPPGGASSGSAERMDAAASTIPGEAVAAVESASLATVAAHKLGLTGCPHCASRQLQRWGSANGLPRYRCTACRRSCNALTGTPPARLRKKEQWPAQALITGESLVKAAERCEIATTTAFRWRHRFLAAAVREPRSCAGDRGGVWPALVVPVWPPAFRVP